MDDDRADWVRRRGFAARRVVMPSSGVESWKADPVALLIQFLVAFGVAAGRHAPLRIEASHHYPNEFCVLVGGSGKGRKGSSWDHVEALAAAADPDFVAARLASGLSSGEGLIAEVRDPLDDADKTAPADKRLLVLEPEFAQVMKVLAREGNTLSPVVRTVGTQAHIA